MLNRLFPKKKDRPSIKLCFIHIPKCAGTSVVVALRQQYQHTTRVESFDHGAGYHALRHTRKTWDAEEWQIEWFKYRQLSLHNKFNLKPELIYGHMPFFSDLKLLFSEYKFITVLRDPVERFISNYIYDKTGPGVRIPDNLDQGSLLDELNLYLQTTEARWLAKEQVSMLSGFSFSEDYDERQALERAKSNLDCFDVIDESNKMDLFASEISQLLK